MSGIKALENMKELYEGTIENTDNTVEALLGDTIEKIRFEQNKVNIELLKPSQKNPYRVETNTAEYIALKNSIEEQGILEPLIVKEIEDGYEILSGERRYTCAKELGIRYIQVRIAKNITEEDEDLIIAYSNNYRENKRPSDKAKDILLKYNALKRKQGGDRKSDDFQVNGERTKEIIAKKLGISSRTVMNYLRIAELSPGWQNALDGNLISLNLALQISYLEPKIQEMLFTISALIMPAKLKKKTKKCKLEIEDIKQLTELTYTEEFHDIIKENIEDIVNKRIEYINKQDEIKRDNNEVKKKKIKEQAKNKVLTELMGEIDHIAKTIFTKDELIDLISKL